MTQKLQALTQDTLIPISLVITLIGGVSWLTTLYNETKANAAAISDIYQEQKLYQDKIDRVLVKLSRIEGKLGILPK